MSTSIAFIGTGFPSAPARAGCLFLTDFCVAVAADILVNWAGLFYCFAFLKKVPHSLSLMNLVVQDFFLRGCFSMMYLLLVCGFAFFGLSFCWPLCYFLVSLWLYVVYNSDFSRQSLCVFAQTFSHFQLCCYAHGVIATCSMCFI